jgi:hypothetical protein
MTTLLILELRLPTPGLRLPLRGRITSGLFKGRVLYKILRLVSSCCNTRKKEKYQNNVRQDSDDTEVNFTHLRSPFHFLFFLTKDTNVNNIVSQIRQNATSIIRLLSERNFFAFYELAWQVV